MIDKKRLHEAIGSAIEKWRNGQNPKLTQRELATVLQVKRTTLSAIESGKQKVPLHLLYRISAEFAVPVSQFLPPPQDFLLNRTKLEDVPEKTRLAIARLREKN